VKTFSFTVLLTALIGTTALCLDDEKQKAQPQAQTQQNQPQLAKEAYLGVSVEAVPPAMRSQMRGTLADGQGILVTQVAKDSPAGKAGLQVYDILLNFGNEKLTAPDQLVKLVRSNKPGEAVAISYLRNGKTADVKVTLGERLVPMAFLPPENPNVFRLFPDERFQMMFEENEIRNGEKHWSSFDSMKLTRVDANNWSAEIEFRTKDGKKESKKFSGTRQELRKQIQDEKDLPESEKNHLLRALNLRPPVFEFHVPTPGSIQQNSGQQP